MKLKPLNDLVMIEIKNKEENITTDSGIILQILENTDTNDRQDNGIAVRIGSDVSKELLGKRVFFEKLNGVDYEEDDQRYVLLDEARILGYSEI